MFLFMNVYLFIRVQKEHVLSCFTLFLVTNVDTEYYYIIWMGRYVRNVLLSLLVVVNYLCGKDMRGHCNRTHQYTE